MARRSVKIGIIMLVGWIIPVTGIVLALMGIYFALMDRKRSRPDLVKAGLFLNTLGLALALVNLGVSIYLISTGAFDSLMHG